MEQIIMYFSSGVEEIPEEDLPPIEDDESLSYS